jgi:hypothetical protein
MIANEATSIAPTNACLITFQNLFTCLRTAFQQKVIGDRFSFQTTLSPIHPYYNSN